MADAWQYRPASLVLSDSAGAALRARKANDNGETVGRRVRVAVRRSGPDKAGTPLGALFLRWRGEEDGPVTIYYLGWDPAAGGTEQEIRRAAAQLAGAQSAEAGS